MTEPIEIIEFESKGPWPENVFADVNSARIRLENEGWIGTNYYLAGPYKTMKCLDVHLPDESGTYRAFLLNNNLIASIIEQEDDAFVAMLSYGTDFEKSDVVLRKTIVKINNVICKQPTPPSKLTDEELLVALRKPYAPIGIIREATKRTFQSLKEVEE